jgi:hypothetical protein
MPSTVCLTFDFDALSVWLACDEPTAAMLWRGEYGARLTLAMHPQVIGRGRRMAMLERFVAHCRDAGATFARTADVARSLPEAA